LNILYSILIGGWGGLEQYPFTVYPYLKKRGYNIFFLVLKNSRAHQECINRKIPYFTMDYYKKFSFKIINRMREIILENNIDIVHFNKSREIYNWRFALNGFPGVKLIMTQHIGISNKNDFIHKWFYKRLDAAIAVTRLLYNRMIKYLPVPEYKINLLYNGVDLTRFTSKSKSTFRKEFKIPADYLLFLCVGNLSPAKGAYEFIEAGIQLSKKYKKIKFIWVGEDKYSGVENFKEKLEDIINKNNADKYFIFTGFRKDIPDILKASDVFILASHNETFGIVYIEAMASGKPVIGCNSGGVPEIIENNKNGYLVKPGDAVELYFAMEKYIRNKKLIKIHGAQSEKKAQFFSMKNHINRLVDIYNSR